MRRVFFAQVISGDYGHSIFQAAYACDRFERVWRELQYQGPAVVKAEIESQIGKIVKEGILPQLGDVNIEEVFLRIGFVHRWPIESDVSLQLALSLFSTLFHLLTCARSLPLAIFH